MPSTIPPNGLDGRVALGKRWFRRPDHYGGAYRWDHDPRCRSCRQDRLVDRALIVGAIGGETLDGAVELAEQVRDNTRISRSRIGQLGGDDEAFLTLYEWYHSNSAAIGTDYGH